MESFIALAALIVIGVPFGGILWVASISSRVRRLQFEFEELQSKVYRLSQSPKVTEATSSQGSEIQTAKEESPWQPPPLSEAPQEERKPLQPAPSPFAPRYDSEASKTKPVSEWQKKIVENWTGILGAVILVIGVAFFGILASLYLEAFYRFCILLGVGAGLAGCNFVVRKKERWADLGAWLQAAGGAIVLFACVGAGGIPGLQFIQDSLTGLIVLSAGMLVNVIFSYSVRSQAIASLHVVMGLAALMVAPAVPMILMIGTAVTVAGIFLSYRDRWDFHLLVCLLAYSVFHAYWRSGVTLPLEDFKLIGVLCVLLVGTASGAVHYRKEYEARSFQSLPFIVHVLNWGLMGFGFLSYSQGSPFTTYFIIFAAVAAHVLARLARKRQIHWLYITDTLVGQALAMLAISRLGRFGMQTFDMAMLAYFEVLVFNWVSSYERERNLLRVGFFLQWVLAATIGYVTVLGGFDFVSPPYPEPRPVHTGLDMTNLPHAFRFLIMAFATIGVLKMLSKNETLDTPSFVFKNEDSKEISILSMFAGLCLSAVYGLLVNEPWAAWAYVGILFGLFWAQKRFVEEWLFAPAMLSWLLGHFLMGAILLEGKPNSERYLLTATLPWLVFDVGAWLGNLFRASWAGPKFIRGAIYLIASNLALSIYLYLTPMSDFAPGVAYLVLSLVFLEIAELRFRAKQGDQDYLLHAGLFFLALFFSRHLTVHMQSEASLGFLSYRLLIELIALSVLTYWAYLARDMEDGWGRVTQRVAPFLAEATLFFLIFVISLEAPAQWHPVGWAVLSILGVQAHDKLSLPPRFLSYSWLFHLASGIQLAFVTSTFETPVMKLWERPWLTGVIAIAFQLAYVVFAYGNARLAEPSVFPTGLKALGRTIDRFLVKRKNSSIFYPFVFAVAIFLYWRFDRGVLTLLWVGEIFGLLSLGIYLKEKHFASFALVALVLCAIRLFVYDLASSSVAIKAGVFIAVGLLVLVMHIIRRKFSHRLN